MIECRNVRKKYGSFLALDNVSFQVPAQKCYGFLGPNGAGKTTTLRLLSGLLHPDTGNVQIAGHSVLHERNLVQRLCGYLPQNPAFYSWMTGAEFLRFNAELLGIPVRQTKRLAEKYLSRVGLSRFANRKIGKYSGGMQQRLGLAQALISEPQVLLLDEPVSSLDPQGRGEVLRLLTELKQEKTILFSSHILHDIEQVCDGIIIINQGKICLQGSLSDILNSPEQSAEWVNCQVNFKAQREQVTQLRSSFPTTFAQQGIVLRDLNWKENGLEELYRKVVTEHGNVAP